MNKIAKILFSILTLGATTASAQSLTVVHGIDGGDIGQNQSLAIDVVVDGKCEVKGLTFRGISPTLKLMSGVRNVEVRLSDGKCGGLIAVTGRFDLALFESATIFAHVTEQKTPVLTKFVDDLTDTDETKARLVFRHGAAAAEVFVNLRRNISTGIFGNGHQTAIEMAAGSYLAKIKTTLSSQITTPTASNTKNNKKPVVVTQPTIAQASLDVGADKIVAVYAVGSVKGGTFGLITQSLK